MRVNLLVSTAEREQLRQLAEAGGVTASAWIRAIIRKEHAMLPAKKGGRK